MGILTDDASHGAAEPAEALGAGVDGTDGAGEPTGEPVHAPPTNCAADCRGMRGDIPGRSYFLGAARAPAPSGATRGTRVSSIRRTRTVGQNKGMRAGISADSSLERSFCGPVGSIVACDPSEELVGIGSASRASTVHTGNTSMNNIRLSSPLGWKKDTAVDGTPKPIRYDQCDSLNRRRCVSSKATHLFKRPAPYGPDLLETKVAVDQGHHQERQSRSDPGDVLQRQAHERVIGDEHRTAHMLYP